MDSTIDLTDTRALRDVLGRFGTGVCVVTGRDDAGATVGMTCQSFMGVSLEPPLVLVSVMRTSRTLPHLKSERGFAVSVLAEGDEAVSAMAGSKVPDKFEHIPMTTTTSGHEVIEGVPAWFACELEAWVEAGDHDLLIGRVLEAGPVASDRGPLLFHGGRYASLVNESVLPVSADLSSLLTATGPGTWF
ncbi:flavin reductase family protein [Dietzia kunjamensis]|uniref:flavin reductase family protein n=1 Tax=Dietzia kunjamensis TaxID=322509 RepID=UPI002DBFC1EF|nr:flavin reductase family protein [Dietzia kunjamensis]MEB8325506.1 flavin reductase family protein [Dietzia kunjamensis]